MERRTSLAVISHERARMTSLWSIVLAAGRGRRLESVTGGVPKQFWAPPGNPSLLEETLTRIAPLTDPVRTVTVVDRSHRPHVERLQPQQRLGTVIYQPRDRGTANGVLLAATLVSSSAPDATVLVTPSDHGVTQPEEMQSSIRAAAEYVQARPGEIVLLGAQASSATGDYGWIVPAPGTSRGTSLVVSFVEKPSAAAAAQLLAAGAVWNTMLLVARVEAVLALYRHHAPDLAAAFESFRFLGPTTREQRVNSLYEHLPHADFSHDVLSNARGLRCMALGTSTGWTDLGTPERLAAWLTRPSGPARATPLQPSLPPLSLGAAG